jgi:hypothetical protein
MLEAAHLAHCFCVRIGLGFERNTECESGFQGDVILIFFPKSYSAELRKHMSLSKKIIYYRSGAFGTLLACENQVSFWPQYCLPCRVFKGNKGSFVQNSPIQVN